MEKISRPAQRPLWTQSWATSSSHSFLFIHTVFRQPKLLVTGHTPPWVSAICPGVEQDGLAWAFEKLGLLEE